MQSIKRYLSLAWRKLRGRTDLQSASRQQEKFRKRYPNYQIGYGTYGMPIVHDLNDGTTLKIGSYTSIAKDVEIYLGGNHRLDWVTTYPFPAFIREASHIKNYDVSRGDVVIGSDVWLCADCTILSGVTIGHGAVVANNAVVTKNVAPYSVVAGNPAKHVKWRFDEATREVLLKSAWWEWSEDEIMQNLDKLCSDNIVAFLGYVHQRDKSSISNHVHHK
jgi:acetyltransferase-like isoleucine patch superfamily enzyme